MLHNEYVCGDKFFDINIYVVGITLEKIFGLEDHYNGLLGSPK